MANLVLSRRHGQKIVIGDNIVVTIVDVQGDKVRLGIEAPKDIPVHRQEIYEAIQRGEIKKHLVGIDQDETNRLLRRDGLLPGQTNIIPAASQHKDYRDLQDLAAEALAEQAADEEEAWAEQAEVEEPKP